MSASQINLAWAASSGAATYSVFRNGNRIGGTSSLSFSDTALAPQTTYSYQVSAENAAGASPLTSSVTATTLSTGPVPDTTSPTVSISAPQAGATVSGPSVTVAASASDNIGVVGVQFKLDGANLGSEDTVGPYSMTWDTRTSTNAAHTLVAVARDAAGNAAISAAITVTVNNSVPVVTIAAPAAGATVSGSTVAVSATASDPSGLAGVQFRLNGANLGTEDTDAPYSTNWNTLSAADGSYTLTAIARNTSGVETMSSGVTVFVDNTPPAVSVGSPSNGTIVTGTTTLTATASDNVGVAGVQFKIDGVNVVAEYTTVPYSTTWDSRTASNGWHTLTAVARDAAGNTTTSPPIRVITGNLLGLLLYLK